MHLFALCAFGIAQPSYDLLSKNPAYFVWAGFHAVDVVLYGFAADVPAWSEHVLVLTDPVQVGCGAKAGDILVRLEVATLAAPGMIGAGDLDNIVIRELAPGTVHHVTELAGVDEQHLAAPSAEAVIAFGSRQEP